MKKADAYRDNNPPTSTGVVRGRVDTSAKPASLWSGAVVLDILHLAWSGWGKIIVYGKSQ